LALPPPPCRPCIHNHVWLALPPPPCRPCVIWAWSDAYVHNYMWLWYKTYAYMYVIVRHDTCIHTPYVIVRHDTCIHICYCDTRHKCVMGWLWLVGSIKL